jgi:hypothetical protein
MEKQQQNKPQQKHKQKQDYLSFIRRSKYVIKEGIFYVGDNREYEVVIKDLKRNDLLEDETQKLVKIFFNDLREHNLEDVFNKGANEFIVIILNRKVLIRRSHYSQKQVLKKIN